MALVEVEEIQALGADGGVDAATLEEVIAREEAEMIRKFGAHYSGSTPLVERIKGGAESIYLSRPIGAVTSIAEYLYLGDTAPATLATTDYFIWATEGRIERVLTAAKWGALVSVTYTPVDDTALRKSVLVDLVRLATSEDAGGGSVSGLGFSISGGSSNARQQRATLYARLGWLGR